MTRFPPDPRAASLEWVQRQLVIAFPENAAREPERLAEYGESLFVVATQNHIPAETLLWWIHYRPQNKDFSVSAWRLWCARYADAAARLPDAAAEPPAPPDAPEPAIICVRCYARVVQRIDKLWWCSVCGEIQI